MSALLFSDGSGPIASSIVIVGSFAPGRKKRAFASNRLLYHLSNRPGVPETLRFRVPEQATSGDSLRLVSAGIPPFVAVKRSDDAKPLEIKVLELNRLKPRRHPRI
jgi:hypothetical protein